MALLRMSSRFSALSERAFKATLDQSLDNKIGDFYFSISFCLSEMRAKLSNPLRGELTATKETEEC